MLWLPMMYLLSYALLYIIAATKVTATFHLFFFIMMNCAKGI